MFSDICSLESTHLDRFEHFRQLLDFQSIFLSGSIADEETRETDTLGVGLPCQAKDTRKSYILIHFGFR